MSSSEHDKSLRAQLAAELGWYPAKLDDESVARHRADKARGATDRDPTGKWAHLTEDGRTRDVEAAGRAAVADLYDEGGIPKPWRLDSKVDPHDVTT